jgi:hypothetical protein
MVELLSQAMRWYPDHTRSTSTPEAGDLIAFRHAAWRVIEVNPVPEDGWTEEEQRDISRWELRFRAQVSPTRMVIRPARIAADDPRSRDHDLHLRVGSGLRTWDIYIDEHYPLCAQCGEPTPCRDRLGQLMAQQALDKMSRYELSGTCPACWEPVTGRQKSVTFSDNLEIPGGPAVTFHIGRGRCRSVAAKYEQRWVAGDPTARRTTLSCPGDVTNHNDGTYDCTELNGCRGPTADHPSYTRCRCPDCHAGSPFGCDPRPNAVRRQIE